MSWSLIRPSLVTFARQPRIPLTNCRSLVPSFQNLSRVNNPNINPHPSISKLQNKMNKLQSSLNEEGQEDLATYYGDLMKNRDFRLMSATHRMSESEVSEDTLKLIEEVGDIAADIKKQ